MGNIGRRRRSLTALTCSAALAVAACENAPPPATPAPIPPQASAVTTAPASPSAVGPAGPSAAGSTPSPLGDAAAPGPARVCAAELDALEARQGSLGADSPGLLSVDTWDQDCQWRVEDLEQALGYFWGVRRGKGTGAEALAFAHERVRTETIEFVNGPLPPDVIDKELKKVHLGPCFRGQAGAPTRLRVRLTVPQKGGAPQHVATDYRTPIADASRACVERALEKASFPAPTFGKWVIIVHAFDAR